MTGTIIIINLILISSHSPIRSAQYNFQFKSSIKPNKLFIPFRYYFF